MPQPILGADFLEHFHLAPYILRCLVDTRSKLPVECLATSTPSLGNSSNDRSRHLTISGLLKEFSEVTRPALITEPRHTVQHQIVTTGNLANCRVRPLPPDKLKAAKAEFEQMLNQGIFRVAQVSQFCFSISLGAQTQRRMATLR